MKKLLLAALITSAGCYTDAEVGVGYSGGNPDLVEVEGDPGVSVVADADYPVFFTDGLYWRWYGGTWYSSPYYGRGWVVARTVPVTVRGIREPGRYVHYRATLAREGRTPRYVGRSNVVTRRNEPVRRAEPVRHAEPARRVEPRRETTHRAPVREERREEKK